jgi:hypothetical protein
MMKDSISFALFILFTDKGTGGGTLIDGKEEGLGERG